jgi:hypothetical protein
VPARGLRGLVQGDSVTWGQGVQDESALYPARLLERLRRGGAEVEMAVLAAPGRNIDEHLSQLREWGAGLRPDVILYQWHVNDLDVGKHIRVAGGRALPWRRLFCHRLLYDHSYLWFFLDNRLAAVWPGPSYTEAMLGRFAADTAAWRDFEVTLAGWATEARRLTPRVLVLLYPSPGYSESFAPRVAKVDAAARGLGLGTLDLTADLAALSADPRELMATPFDPHPNAAVHAAIAERAHRRLLELWPELADPAPALARAGG